MRAALHGIAVAMGGNKGGAKAKGGKGGKAAAGGSASDKEPAKGKGGKGGKGDMKVCHARPSSAVPAPLAAPLPD